MRREESSMKIKRLADEELRLGAASIIQEMLSPAYKVYEHEHEPGEEPGPKIAHLDVLHDRANTWALNAAGNTDEMQEIQPQFLSRVIGINVTGWFVTNFAGSPDFIHALAAKAEALGAKRITT
jgi:hypothetical protein